jgi:hypothetical protein
VDNDNDSATDCVDMECVGSTDCTGSDCTPDTDLGSLAVGGELTHTADTSSATNGAHLSCAASDGGDHVVAFTLAADAYVYTEMDQATGSGHAVGIMFQGGAGSACDDVEFICLDLPASTGDVAPDASGYFTTGAPMPAGTYYIIYEVQGTGGTMDLLLRAVDTVTETDCTDGVDDDGNGLVDCEDPDCTRDPSCAGRGVYEWFEEGTSDTFDLATSMLTFTPVTGHPDGFVWALTPSIGAFPFTAGTGAVTAPLDLGDDDAAEVTFTSMTSGFELFGTTYTELNVGSNGVCTLGAGNANTGYAEGAAGLFAYPTVAPLWDDFDPTAGGSVTYDEWPNRVVVTFDSVPQYGDTAPNSFQLVLWDDGHINMAWLGVAAPDGAIGVTDGGGGVTLSGESDFN